MKARDLLAAIGALTASLALSGAFAIPALARPAKAPAAPIARPAQEPAPTVAPRVDENTVPSNVFAQSETPPPWPEPLWLLEGSAGDRAAGERRGDGGARRSGEERQGHGGMNMGMDGGMREGAQATRAPEAGGASAGAPAANGSTAVAPVDANESNGMMSMGRMGGSKTLVLKRGSDPATAQVTKLEHGAASLQILGADGKRWETPFIEMGKNGVRAKVELENMGFYNAYLLQKSAHAGVLDVQVAQAELLKGGMGHAATSVDPELFKPTLDDAAPIQLVREHAPDEKLMTSIHSGEKAAFLVRSYGKPVAGARVSLATQQGWRKTLTTDETGRVEFQLIRDYFPNWSDFNRSQAGVFLVWAQMETPEAGVYDGQSYSTTRYQTSMTARYYPSPYDYRSQATALAIVLFVAAFGGFGVWFYRQRRRTPFKEIVFDERIA